MIVIDANLLIYAYDARSRFHAASRTWLEAALSSDEQTGIPMQAVMAFLRISTNTKLPGAHMTVEEAISAVDSWLQLPYNFILQPGPRHWTIFRKLCQTRGAAGNLTTDVHFAALAIEHDALLCSADLDFAHFDGLRWRNPLAQR